MPKVTNAFTTYNAVGNREDLSNVIYNIDPFDTPIMSAIKRRTVKNRLFDWQIEFLPTVAPSVVPATGVLDVATNAQFEGFALAPSAAQPTVRQNNVTQIQQARRDDLRLAGGKRRSWQRLRDESPDGDGVEGSEVGHGNRDVFAATAGRWRRHGSGGARHRRHLALAWLGRETGRRLRIRPDLPAGAIAPGTSVAGLPTTATGAVPCAGYSSDHRGDSRRCDAEGLHQRGDADTLGCRRRGRSGRSPASSAEQRLRFWWARPKSCRTVDVIATDFGRIKVIPSRWVPPDVGLLIDPDYLAVAFFRSFRQYLMARTGDAETRMIIVEWGVEVRNALAHILFNGIVK